jgi:hypothetical protein
MSEIVGVQPCQKFSSRYFLRVCHSIYTSFAGRSESYFNWVFLLVFC